MREASYQDGKLNGESLTYHRRGGQVQYRETFKDNRRDGKFTEFSPRGNVIKEIQYENGRKVKVIKDNTMGQ